MSMLLLAALYNSCTFQHRVLRAGASDWLDGYVAKRFKQESVLGSYLDPLADKTVIFCVIGALGWAGTLSPAVVTVLIGRDVLLVTGGLMQRCVYLLVSFWRAPIKHDVAQSAVALVVEVFSQWLGDPVKSACV